MHVGFRNVGRSSYRWWKEHFEKLEVIYDKRMEETDKNGYISALKELYHETKKVCKRLQKRIYEKTRDEKYYKEEYGKNILRNIKNSGGRMEYPFRTISDDFSLIDKNTYTLVIRYDRKSEEILNKASFSPFPWSFARKLQRYTVQVYKPDYDKLLENGKIRNIKDVYFVVEKDCYSPDFGLNVEDSTGKVPADYII